MSVIECCVRVEHTLFAAPNDAICCQDVVKALSVKYNSAMPSEISSALDPDSFVSFGDLLRYLRLRARITQRDLSIAVGYNFAHISRLEQGQRLPDPAVVAAVFVSALELEDDPVWAQRLIALAEAARHSSYVSDTLPDTPPHATPTPPRPLDSVPLLMTKLYVPRSRSDLVPRSRLMVQLDQMLHVPLSLIAAPAGFGKTTLLAHWIEEKAQDKRQKVKNTDDGVALLPFEVVWLSLDADDNDLVGFLRYLIAALQTVAPTLGGTVLTLLQAPQPPSTEMLMRVLLNDLATLPQETLLVLDDYHLITAPIVHQALTLLLDHLPPMLHLALATRVDPLLPLARLRARGQLVELRAADIRFTPAEAATFLTKVMGLALNTEDVAALETRTEGWIAGLQLAALAMRDRNDLTGFISAFTGSNRFVVDYLATEVFARQPPHLQTFLLQSSILDRMCGPLCDVVMGIDDAVSQPHAAYTQALLEELERANLFLVPLDDERRWYRYHHLFGSMLRERLLQGAPPAEVARLRKRAGAWYQEQGLIAEAVQQLLTAEDWQQSAQLIEEHGLRVMLRGQLYLGLSWIHMLPEAVMQMHPLLCVIHAIGLMLTNQPAAAEKRLQDAERRISAVDQEALPEEVVRVVQGSVAGIRGRILYFEGDLARAIDSIQQALALLPETTTNVAAGVTSSMARASWPVYLASAYKLTGDVSAPIEQLHAAAIEPVRALGHVMATLNAFTSLAALQVFQGRLRIAAATYAKVEQLVPSQDALGALAGSPSYYIGVGDLLREQNELDAAADYLTRGMDLIRGTLASEADVIMLGYLALARLQQARGDASEALATLDMFMQVAHERKFFHLLIERVAALRARLHLMQNNLSAAVRWAEGSNLSFDGDIHFPHEPIMLTLVRVFIAMGKAQEVMPFLQRLLADAEAKARRHSTIEILILQALSCSALNDLPCALAMLERALLIAEPEGYVRLFVDEGAALAALLRASQHNGIAPTYISRLLAAFD